MISILAASGAEQGFFETFGVNWPFFIAQLINFILVLLVLKKFAFGPIQEILDKRRSRIADGEAKLEEIEQKLADSEKEKDALLAKANDDSKRLIGEAKESAALLSEQKAQEAVSQAQTILAKAQEAARAERATIRSSMMPPSSFSNWV